MKLDIVRAWKDETYRQSLSAEQLHTLPANPAGALELSDADLAAVSGGWLTLIKISDVNVFSTNILGTALFQTCFKNNR